MSLGRISTLTEVLDDAGKLHAELDLAAFAWMIAKVSTGKGIGEPCHARVLMIDAWKGCLISSVSTFGTRETCPSWHKFNTSCDQRRLLPRRSTVDRVV